MNITCKAYINNEWVYGDYEKIIDDESILYYLTTENDKISVGENDICKITSLVDKNKSPIFSNDIISVNFDDSVSEFIVKYYKGPIEFDGFTVYMDGLVLQDFNSNYYLMSDSFVKTPESLTIIGNAISNNINL